MRISALRAFVIAAVAVAALGSTLCAQAAPAAAGSARTSSPSVVPSCAQRVAPGHYTCFALRRTDVGARSGFVPAAEVAASTTGHPLGYGPADLQSAYDLTTASGANGAGQRIYVIDAYDDPRAESDLRAYRSEYRLPACTTANGCFEKINQYGSTTPLPARDPGWASETSLDLDMVSAICPRCAITLIEANDDGDSLYTAIKQANSRGGKFVSISWGGPEVGDENWYDTRYFAPTGVVYSVATGDGGFQAGVMYPATSPNVVAVAGTSLRRASNPRGWVERVWKTDPADATVSGCSSSEPQPSWQSIIPNGVCLQRAIADVAADADPATGVAVYQTYGGNGWGVYGGTSAAAPMIAAIYALAGKPASTDWPASLPYKNRAQLHDITVGNDGSCSLALRCTAATGWDGPTGVGTPNGTAAFTPSQTPASCSGQQPWLTLNPGFESGAARWSHTPRTISTDGAGARTGRGYAELDGYGTRHTDDIARSVSLPAGCTATLTYWLRVDSADTSSTPNDKLVVTVNGKRVQYFSNTNRGPSYVQRRVSLSGYAGQTVEIAWTGTENASRATSFLIDDTAVTITP